jgi:hypothetical protein
MKEHTMNIIVDCASAAHVLALDLTPAVRSALETELALTAANGLTACTDILIIEPGDTEYEIELEAGFSPFVDPLSGARSDQPGFAPCWEILTLNDGVFRLVVTFGGGAAIILLIPDTTDLCPDLLDLCRTHAA